MNVRPAFLLLLAPFFVGAALSSSGIGDHGFGVTKQGNNLVISWVSEFEDGVREFELHRRTPNSSDYRRITTIAAHGPGKRYSYTDDQVYKNAADMVDYQLVVVYQNGSKEVVSTVSINYTSTAVRRTWGSIKAMFQ